MKKFLFAAAALLSLAACNKDNGTAVLSSDVKPEDVVKTITLTATVNFGDRSSETKVAPDSIPAVTSTVNFHWEEGDKILLVSNMYEYSTATTSLFSLNEGSISSDGKTAVFKGEPLSDMSSYNVFYAGSNTDKDTFLKKMECSYGTCSVELDNVKDNYNLIATGSGDENGFSLSEFNGTFYLKLTGTDITLGKIEYYRDDATIPATILKFGTDGLSLGSTAKDVFVPAAIALPGTSVEFRFYDNSDSFIMKKVKTLSEPWYDKYSNNNTLIAFPILNVETKLAAKLTQLSKTDGSW